jgi:hypothetical protein
MVLPAGALAWGVGAGEHEFPACVGDDDVAVLLLE